MLAVWSFWSKPFYHREGSLWGSDYHALLSWVLSVERARRHYPRTLLVTDEEGAWLLVDRLGLPFSRVDLTLEGFTACDPDWWALGKLHAYSQQREPFVHLDSDVFLWKRLPARLEQAPVLAQSPETFRPDEAGHWYPVREVESTFLAAGSGWLPEAWHWFSRRGLVSAACCGIVGGTAVELLRDYADQGIRIAEAPENRRGWSTWQNKGLCNVLIEQFLLGAVVAYRRTHPRNPEEEHLRIEYLFPSDEGPYVPENATEAGYTHLIGGAKRNSGLLANLEARVRADHPEYIERCRHTARLIERERRSRRYPGCPD